MKKILIIDNYDSFTFNLVQYVSEWQGSNVTVAKNDHVELDSLSGFDGIILSPGPGLPEESGKLMKVFDHAGATPILGVCLGHQAIGLYFGAQLRQLDKVYHGVDSAIHILSENEDLFTGIDSGFRAGRYHSWVIDEDSIGGCPLEVTCRDSEGIIMGVRHRDLHIHGVQFHPESVMTPDGRRIIANFLQLTEGK